MVTLLGQQGERFSWPGMEIDFECDARREALLKYCILYVEALEL